MKKILTSAIAVGSAMTLAMISAAQVFALDENALQDGIFNEQAIAEQQFVNSFSDETTREVAEYYLNGGLSLEETADIMKTYEEGLRQMSISTRASVSSPYCCASPKYNPPAEFVIPAIIAMEVIPQNPAAPPIFATRSPSTIPTTNFIRVSVHPLYSGIPIFFTSMDAPFSKRNIPNRQAVPVLNIPDVNPPISSTFGINVLASTPISIGTMLRPDNPIFRKGLSITKATRAI